MTAYARWIPKLRLVMAVAAATFGLTVVAVGTQTVGAPAAHADPSCVIADCPSASTIAGDAACVLMPAACAAKAAVGGVSAQVADAAASLAAAFIGALIRGAGEAVNAVLGAVSKFMTSSTRPNVTAAAFVGTDGPYHKVAQIAALLMILFLLFAVIQQTIAGQPGELVTRIVRSVPLAVLAIVGLPWAVDQLLSLVDAICAWLLPTGATMATIAKVYGADQLQSTLSGGALSLPVLLVQIFAWLGGLVIYLELVVRDALVLITVALAPLSFAAMVWPAARGAARRIAELLAAIILSKLAIWVALLVGIDLFAKQATSPGPDAWGQMIAGAAVLAVACFAPYVVWKLLPVAEAAVIAQGLSRQPGRAAQSAMYTANSARNMTSSFGRGGGGGGGHPSQPAPQPAPSQLPTQSLAPPSNGAGNGGWRSQRRRRRRCVRYSRAARAQRCDRHPGTQGATGSPVRPAPLDRRAPVEGPPAGAPRAPVVGPPGGPPLGVRPRRRCRWLSPRQPRTRRRRRPITKPRVPLRAGDSTEVGSERVAALPVVGPDGGHRPVRLDRPPDRVC